MRKVFVLAFSLGAVIGGLAAFNIINVLASPPSSKLRGYCATVRAALTIDALDLESADPKRRASAAERFGNLITYHSEQEIALCAKSPPDLRGRDTCWFGQDFACLAKLARAAVKAVEP